MDDTDTYTCGLEEGENWKLIMKEIHTNVKVVCVFKLSILYFNKALISSCFVEPGIVSSLAQEKANPPSTTQVTTIVLQCMWIMRQLERTSLRLIMLHVTPYVRILPSKSNVSISYWFTGPCSRCPGQDGSNSQYSKEVNKKRTAAREGAKGEWS